MLISGKNGNLSFEEQRIGSSVTLVFSYFCFVVCGVSSIVPRFLLLFNSIITAMEFHTRLTFLVCNSSKMHWETVNTVFKSQSELWHNLSFVTPTLVNTGCRILCTHIRLAEE